MSVLVAPYGRFLGSRRNRLRGEMAGAVRVDPERDGIADALVVDRGEDGLTGGDGEAVEAVEDGVLDLLAGGRDDQ